MVVRSRLRGRRVPGSKPNSTEDLPYMNPVARKIVRSGQASFRWCGETQPSLPYRVSLRSTCKVSALNQHLIQPINRPACGAGTKLNLIPVMDMTQPCWYGVESCRVGRRLRQRTRQLSKIQNYEVFPI
ncbi:hypothetical protein AVEN_188159-1 [Araneus ventricosus]|uniref:Uncharacterized protein n=1 Tax=Araneus ventricosus TaxID=182803 RepID=A0A4Y2U199_ARAVE|nr:hypothetical protein AVEN_188159-1 [Araneus ventricosus]